MMKAALPKIIRENMARARGYLARGELARALETLSLALREGGNSPLSHAARTEMESQLTAILHDVCRHPDMRPLLDPDLTGQPRGIPFHAGKEGVLATVLEGLAKIVSEAAGDQAQALKAAEAQRRDGLIHIGLEALRSGDLGRGRSFLQRAVAEFGEQAGLAVTLGRHLQDFAQYSSAAQLFETAMEIFPKEAEAYSAAVQAYMQAQEYGKAEAVFKKILRHFGGHASTYGRMAALYLAWDKRAKAEDFAGRALHLDRKQAEALAVLEALSAGKLLR